MVSINTREWLWDLLCATVCNFEGANIESREEAALRRELTQIITFCKFAHCSK